MPRLIKSFLGSVRSTSFFVITLLILIISSGWIALSARFPMAFDEGYHLGIIKLYARQYSPFFGVQPPGSATYGALTRDPSYLFHYLMSFPYRLVGVWSSSPTAHILTLRLIDVALMALGLILLRKVLLKTKASPAIINVTLLFLVLTPVVPLLAAHINYDDLVFPMVALAMLLALNFAEQLKTEHKINIVTLVNLLAICLLASLVKYAFLPIFAAILVYICYLGWRFGQTHKHKLWKMFSSAWRPFSLLKKVWLIALLLVSLGLFVNTYGLNLIQYQNPVPQCGQVLGVQRCKTYAPWARNYSDALYNRGVDANPLRFTASWFYGMFDRLFFTINGPGLPDSNANHIAPIMAITAAALAGFGALLFLIFGRRLVKRDSALGFLLFVSLIYCLALWGRNYHDFLHLGQMVAINGRYLVPIITPVYLALALSYQQLLRRRPTAQIALLIVALVLFCEGGGAISYIYYSKDSWYWPGNSFVRQTNHELQRLIRPLFISR